MTEDTISPPSNDYLQALLNEGEKLDQRETAVDKKEAEIRAERASIASHRERLQAAKEHYREFLQSVGRPVPDSLLSKKPASVRVEPVNASLKPPAADDLPQNVIPRAGEQRAAVLEAIAYLSVGDEFTTNREIRQKTNLSPERISNVIYADVKRGLLERRSGRVRMTPMGYEFLRQLGSPAGNANDPKGKTASDLERLF